MKSILECLEMMEEEVGSLKEKISDFRAAHRVHEERCINDDIVTTNKINSMNEKVFFNLTNAVIINKQLWTVR